MEKKTVIVQDSNDAYQCTLTDGENIYSLFLTIYGCHPLFALMGGFVTGSKNAPVQQQAVFAHSNGYRGTSKPVVTDLIPVYVGIKKLIGMPLKGFDWGKSTEPQEIELPSEAEMKKELKSLKDREYEKYKGEDIPKITIEPYYGET
ncbi:MAG: hypothetical protein L6Q59_13805 [Ignavibacteriaceae bacterium]|nr:hypothetical protein [Ignavibacteriaceae bacterium]